MNTSTHQRKERSMRKLYDHEVTDTDKLIGIEVLDDPGAGLANHHYAIMIPGDNLRELHFQKGPVAENGINGITQETLIAIVIDRLRGFQKGPYACRENAIALTHMEDAMHWLHHRTRARIARGVEGKSEV